MRLRALARLVRAVPAVASWGEMAAAGGMGLVTVVLAAWSQGSVVLRVRLAGAAVAASTAWLLDDSATATLAASPTTVLARRAVRVAVGFAFALGWWGAAAAAATAVAGGVPVAAAAEVVVLTALAVAGSVAGQRWSGDGRGASAGALVVLVWFLLSFVPDVGAVPLPPQPLRPGATGPLLAVAGAALVAAVALSRDPAARRLLPVRSRH